MSQALKNFILRTERFSPIPYNDPANNATIGFGHLLHLGPVTAADVAKWGSITKAEALRIFESDVQDAKASVLGLVKVPLTRGQLDALVDFTFNFNAHYLANSTLLKLLNESRYSEVPGQLRLWVHGGGQVLPGLVRRREADILMWTRGIVP